MNAALHRTRLWKPVLVAAGAAMFVATLGALMTDLGPWYHSLRQPAWKPPDQVFGPVWTTIFALAAAAGVNGWRHARSRADRERMLLLFAMNGFLNVFWSLLYFRLHRPDWALVEVPFLWLSVLALIVLFSGFARAAVWMLVPYLVWVAIAAALNFETVRLNGPLAGA
ncbi:TspO/MBR family protein [Variovorax sp. J22R133]|uniref:TspO/MBR family protein n=1 Tax=Variovorax brevis TaxID=3053503 RepID=UPI0025785DA6|nr:TspO/MBR family protein [Variovorax sp. J22R133]MDM0113820.1 TspO/MBR family protein [Variovorax sp. J22R133]